jgi:hypothetical protein
MEVLTQQLASSARCVFRSIEVVRHAERLDRVSSAIHALISPGAICVSRFSVRLCTNKNREEKRISPRVDFLRLDPDEVRIC